MNDFLYLTPNDRGLKLMDEFIRDTYQGTRAFLIGKSIEGREIKTYTVGEGAGRVAFFGAHHASEWITCNLLFAFLSRISDRARKGASAECDILRSFTFFVTPCVNPDGISLLTCGPSSPLKERQIKMLKEAKSPWQANARGVDLNHNYPFGFSQYKEIEKERGIREGATLYSGEYPESEPETASVCRLVRTVAPKGIVSLHSVGEEIFHRPSEKNARIAERMSALSGYLPKVPTGTASFGGLCDYTSSLGIPSFTVEVGRGKSPLDISELDRIFERIYPMLLYFPTVL